MSKIQTEAQLINELWMAIKSDLTERLERKNVFYNITLGQQFRDNTSRSTVSHMCRKQKVFLCDFNTRSSSCHIFQKHLCVYLSEKEETNVHHMCSLSFLHVSIQGFTLQ